MAYVQPVLSLSSQPNSLHRNDERRGWTCPCERFLKQEKGRHPPPPSHHHNSTVRCRTCVGEQVLGPALVRQHEARRQRDAARAAHVDRVGHTQHVSPPDVILSQLRDESDQYRTKLASLQHACGTAAVQLTSTQLVNDEQASLLLHRQEQLTHMQDDLVRLEDALLHSPSSMPVHDSNLDEERSGGSLSRAIQESSRLVKEGRFQLALCVFDMHRLRVVVPTLNTTTPSAIKQPKGIGTIGGLPLPHAGPTLYGVLPANVLSSSLRLVASLTSTVARCLGIQLPHPILLQPCLTRSNHPPKKKTLRKSSSRITSVPLAATFVKRQQGDIIETVLPMTSKLSLGQGGGGSIMGTRDTLVSETPPQTQQQPAAPSSLLSLFSPTTAATAAAVALSSSSNLLGKSARRVFGRVKSGKGSISSPSPPSSSSSLSHLHSQRHYSNDAVSSSSSILEYGLSSSSSNHKNSHAHQRMSMEQTAVEERIRHATAAVVSDTTVHYYLDASHTPETEGFAVGLQLLQNDVIALCIRAGVNVDALWPAEALLLNLHALHLFCQDQIK